MSRTRCRVMTRATIVVTATYTRCVSPTDLSNGRLALFFPFGSHPRNRESGRAVESRYLARGSRTYLSARYHFLSFLSLPPFTLWQKKSHTRRTGSLLCHGALRPLIVTPLHRPLRFHDGHGFAVLTTAASGGKDRFTSRCVSDKWRSRGVTNEIRISRIVLSHPPLTLPSSATRDRRDARVAKFHPEVIFFQNLIHN